MEARHEPVMVKESLQFLKPSPGQVIVDCTIGAGGHARALLERILPGGTLIGLDVDEDMLALARQHLADYKDHVRFFHANFKDLSAVLSQVGCPKVDGMLFDLGVSSAQLDDPNRGLSFQREGPLDMRLDRSRGVRAYEIVNTYPEAKLAEIFRGYGEERHARKIARRIVQERSKGPILSTLQLARLVSDAVGGRRERIHPATRCFLALRIVVNSELSALRDALDVAPDYLKSGGRIVVIAFHSLEDRIVKQAFRAQADTGIMRILTRKVVFPSQEEVARNPRSRSARMRAAERTSVEAAPFPNRVRSLT